MRHQTPDGDVFTGVEHPLPVTPGLPTADTPRTLIPLGNAFTRPANTTQYAVGDAVNAGDGYALFWEHAGLAPGRGGVVLHATLDKSGTTVTGAAFRLHLFAADVAAPNDNDPLPTLWTDRFSYFGYIDFPTMTVGTGTNTGARAIAERVNLPYVTDEDGVLYGLLEARGAYTPASVEQFYPKLLLARD